MLTHQLCGRVDQFLGAVVHLNFVHYARRCHDEVEVVFALQALLHKCDA